MEILCDIVTEEHFGIRVLTLDPIQGISDKWRNSKV